jgi:hypothetical protein
MTWKGYPAAHTKREDFMAVKAKVDTYANYAAVKVVESAANTQTSLKFAFPFSIMDKMALVISRVEYWFPLYTQLNSTADGVYMGLLASASVVDVGAQNDPLIVDSAWVSRVDFGAAASGMIDKAPFIKDFSSLPGAGILVAPAPLYGFVASTGCAAANTVWIKMFYTYIELATDEYWQLVESRRIISS